MRVDDAKLERYEAYLKDKSRPPSKGGNTRAWHQHIITIDGEKYSFPALGKRQWVFASDTVSFEWNWDPSGQYRNIDANSIQVKNKNGERIERGIRGSKPWRTASARLPVSRREQRD